MKAKEGDVVARMITAKVLPAYCGKLAGIGRRTGSSREAYGCFYSWWQLGRQRAGRLCRRCLGENGFLPGQKRPASRWLCLWTAPPTQNSCPSPGRRVLCYVSRICGKAKSKIGLAQELAPCLQKAETASCAVFGSWQLNRYVNPHFWAEGYGLVCALGANRAICPADHRVQIKEFSRLAEKIECCLVAANSKSTISQACDALERHCKPGGAYKMA
ncbi:MAG: hypothetical protein FWG10_02855 [Eubacteriaceae bacterium]|nr:hypothetical protein [Eubacteriaceae bacterium]